VLFAQLWGVGGVRILTFTVIPTPFMRTSRRVGVGSGAHFERSLNVPDAGRRPGFSYKTEPGRFVSKELRINDLEGNRTL
jgi:hypothetical protein